MLAPDGVDRREVQHVEAHVADRWQTLVHVAEGAVSIGVIGLRAREQLVPAGELGQRSFDVQRIDRAATAVLARVGRGHGCSGFRRQQQRHAFVFQCAEPSRCSRSSRIARFSPWARATAFSSSSRPSSSSS